MNIKKLTADFFDLFFEFGQFVLHNRPYSIYIYTEIAVYKDVSHTDNLGPWNVRIFFFEFIRYFRGSLPKDLEMMKNPCLNKFIIVEYLFTAPAYLLIRSIESRISSSRSLSFLIARSLP